MGAKAEGDAGNVARVGEQVGDALADLRRAQDRAVASDHMFLSAHPLDLGVRGGDLMAELGVRYELAGNQRLKMKPKPVLARHSIRAVRHEPQHPFGPDVAARAAKAI